MAHIPIPTADQFHALALASDEFEDTFREQLIELLFDSYFPGRARLPQLTKDIVNVPQLAADLAVLANSLAKLKDDAGVAIDWLESQPSFQLTMQVLNFSFCSNERLQAVFEEIIHRWLEKSPNALRLVHMLLRVCGQYSRYASGIALASYRYTTKQATNEAIEGFRIISEIRDRVLELEKLIDHPYLPHDARWLSRGTFLRTAIKRVKCEDFMQEPVTRRNDADLPARLMCVEIIRLHNRLFRATHKRAVYHLMGLPFVESELEMRTIERLAKAEKDRR